MSRMVPFRFRSGSGTGSGSGFRFRFPSGIRFPVPVPFRVASLLTPAKLALGNGKPGFLTTTFKLPLFRKNKIQDVCRDPLFAPPRS